MINQNTNTTHPGNDKSILQNNTTQNLTQTTNDNQPSSQDDNILE
jgi:hypothetical protein